MTEQDLIEKMGVLAALVGKDDFIVYERNIYEFFKNHEAQAALLDLLAAFKEYERSRFAP